jgi:hypothetical protein
LKSYAKFTTQKKKISCKHGRKVEMNSYEREVNKKLENLKKKVAEQWKFLNEYGIYTEKDLDKAIKETELDIGIFVTPLKNSENI